MRRLITMSALLRLCSFSILLSPTIATAAPGPDETAESATYDITLQSRNLGTYSGQAIFEGDPERPQDRETGALTIELTLPDDTSGAVVAGTGTWWSYDVWFFGLWFASADTDSGGQIVAGGLSFGDRLFGRSGVFGDADIAEGRYGFRGNVAAEAAP